MLRLGGIAKEQNIFLIQWSGEREQAYFVYEIF